MRNSTRALGLWLATAFKAAPLLATLQCLIVVVNTGLAPLQTYGVKLMIDGVTGTKSHLMPGALIIICSFGIGIITQTALDLPLRSTVNDAVHRQLHGDLLALISGIPGIAHHERPEVADRIEQLTQNAAFMSYSAGAMLMVVATIANTATVFTLLAGVHPILLLLPALGLLRVWAATINGRMRWQAIERTTPHARLIHRLVDIGTAPQHGMEIRLFGLRPVLLARLREMLAQLRAVQLAANRRGAALESAARLVFGIGYIAAIAFIVVRARHGSVSAGDVALVVLLAGRVDQAAGSLAATARDLGRMLGMFGGYVWLRDYAKSAQWSGTAPAPARLLSGITLRGAEFSYPDSPTPALSTVDFHISAGATIALVGENGAGKTTLVKLLARLYDPSSGAVLVDGVDLREIDPLSWRSRISAGFQDFNRYEFTAAQAVGVGDLSTMDDPRVMAAALDRGDANAVVERLPDGLETQLGKRFEGGVDLSGGQWQRLALARAFMRTEPLLLLLDEPTAALDPEAEHALFDRFTAASAHTRATGGITVLVSHRFSTVRMADLIVVMVDGRIAETGSHQELVASGGRYAELFDLQARAYR